MGKIEQNIYEKNKTGFIYKICHSQVSDILIGIEIKNIDTELLLKAWKGMQWYSKVDGVIKCLVLSMGCE